MISIELGSLPDIDGLGSTVKICRYAASQYQGSNLRQSKSAVGVAFLDELDDEVTWGSKRDVVGHAPRHAGMQDGNELAFDVKMAAPESPLPEKRAVLLAEVEDRDLPGTVLERVTRIASNSEKRQR